MSLMHWTILSQVEGGKVEPRARERFSRQLVPDRASCSLSGEGGREGGREGAEGGREGAEGGREGGREGAEGGREGGWEGREGGEEGGREGGWGGREGGWGGREGGEVYAPMVIHMYILYMRQSNTNQIPRQFFF